MTINVDSRSIDLACAIARRAGREIMAVYAGDFAVETKADSSPVTAADRAAEALIDAAIRAELTGAFPIVAEEAFAAGRAPVVRGVPFWLVDPLDGTKEFVKRNGEFTVNIALIDAGRPVLGVVYAPVLDLLYVGSAYGSFVEEGGRERRRVRCRPAPRDGLVAVVSRSHLTPEDEAYLATLPIKARTSAGSSLKFCRVAEGAADVYPRLGPTREWDTAAGHAVLRFAGGAICDLGGGELTYGKPGFANPPFVARGAPGSGAEN